MNFSYQHSVIRDNVSKLGVIVALEAKEKMIKLIFLENNYLCILLHQILLH